MLERLRGLDPDEQTACRIAEHALGAAYARSAQISVVGPLVLCTVKFPAPSSV